MKYSINIIGYGYVGGAMGHLCKINNLPLNVHDRIKKEDSYDQFTYYADLKEMVRISEQSSDISVYFICVPTPSDSDGNCNTSIVESVVSELSTLITKSNSIVVIKSTIRVGTTRRLNNIYNVNSQFNLLFCPEFLRELTFKDDIANAKFTMFGLIDKNNNELVQNLSELFKEHLYKHKDNMDFYIRKAEECEIFKYTVNVFLSVKVWFFNEMYEVCEKFDVDYQSFKELLPLDQRIGTSHTTIPGYHGFGFNGTCFPKDSRELRQLQESVGIPNDALREILNRNETFLKK
jgi:UDPglucose 6-dehydrogenase